MTDYTPLDDASKKKSEDGARAFAQRLNEEASISEIVAMKRAGTSSATRRQKGRKEAVDRMFGEPFPFSLLY